VARAVWHALDSAAAIWRRRSNDERTRVLARTARQLRARGPGRWGEALQRSTGLSAAGLEAAWDTTFAPHDRDSMLRALREESLDEATLVTAAERNLLARRILHVVAGNVLPATWILLARGWLLGAAQWLRPSEREPLFAACLLADLGEIAPELAACTALLWWPFADAATSHAVVAGSHAVTVQGSDDAVAAWQHEAGRCKPAPLFIGYGSRWSGALVTRAGQTRDSARGAARDVALFDQQGCLSPTLLFAERGAGLEQWCRQLAEELVDLERNMPRGPLGARARAALRSWHENARLDQAVGDLQGLWAPERSTAWGVVLLRRCAAYESPLDRHVVVVPFSDPEEIVRGLGSHLERLQGLALAAPDWSDSKRKAVLERLQPTRTAPVGSLQLAPLGWPQDHHRPLRSLIPSR
jgi:acyl-CoA reductase-like NAD-dependent aldehyde dehydrogenase